MTRGLITHMARAKQVIIWPNMRWGSVTPTDIDSYLEFDGRVFVFIEVKLRGVELQTGQELAFVRLGDVCADANRHSLLVVSEHRTQTHEIVVLGDTSVRRYCIDASGWVHPPSLMTTLHLVAWFVKEYAGRDLTPPEIGRLT